MGNTVGEKIQDEIKRNYELLQAYRDIGHQGQFGAAMIQADLDAAHQALKDDDVVQILIAYDKLKGNK